MPFRILLTFAFAFLPSLLAIAQDDGLKEKLFNAKTAFTAEITKLPAEVIAGFDKLFRMSSELSPGIWDAANAQGYALKPHARGVVINADPSSLVRFLDIGTRITLAGS